MVFANAHCEAQRHHLSDVVCNFAPKTKPIIGGARKKKMQAITKIQACDGKLFDNEADCVKYEKTIAEIKDVMSTLKPVPTDCDFSNGDGFIQQEIPTVANAMVRIVEIAGIEKKPEFINDPFACRFGIIGRFIDDGGNTHLWRAWSRFMNMDHLGREWGKSFFAHHPEEGKQRDRAAEINGTVQN